MSLFEKFYWKNLSSLQKTLIVALSPYGAGFIGLWLTGLGLCSWDHDSTLILQVESCLIDPVSIYFWKMFNWQMMSAFAMLVGLPILYVWVFLSAFQWYLVTFKIARIAIDNKAFAIGVSLVFYLIIFWMVPLLISDYAGLYRSNHAITD